MKFVLGAFSLIHGLLAVLFASAAVSLIVIATRNGWLALTNGLNPATAQEVIEMMGLLAAAVVALQIAQTIAEEEVVRGVHVSGPTRVRRFLSRFLVVVLVALIIESLVATFKACTRPQSISYMLHRSSFLQECFLLAGGLLCASIATPRSSSRKP